MSAVGEHNTDIYPKWATEAVHIVPYDPLWPEKAQNEIRDLKQKLSAEQVSAFEHVGSTSIPGTPAKPIIDIIAEVPDFERIEAIARRLRPEGWHLTPPHLDQRPHRRFFIKVVDEKRAAHLQLLLPGSPHRTEQIKFRDLLRASETQRTAYAELKQQLATQHKTSREAYTNAKTTFVKNTLSTAPIRIIFATNNEHKVTEIRTAVGEKLNIVSLRDAGIDIDIPEPWDTLEANATEKSSTIHKLTRSNCFSEDTGLEVDALNRGPGVHSARYAGEPQSYEANTQKLLTNLAGIADRRARFRTVVSLIWEEKEHLFEGVCEGEIAVNPAGENGWGYDPIFIPAGETRTFAEMTAEEKNHYSHRRKAVDKLVAFLRSI